MLKDQNAERHTRLQRELGQLCYRRLMLTRELEGIDKTIVQLEGAVAESQATRRDIQTDEAIQAAKAAQEQPQCGGEK